MGNWFAGFSSAIMGVAAGTQTATSGTVVFSNSNNVTFGMSNSSVITASYDQGMAPSAYSADTASMSSGTLVLSNSNNMSFGMSGNTVTASRGPTVSFFQPYNTPRLDVLGIFNAQGALPQNNFTNENSPQFFPIEMPNGQLICKTARFIMAVGATYPLLTSATSMAFTLGMAMYSFLNSSQISLFCSDSLGISATNASIYAGLRFAEFTNMSTVSITGGKYLLALSQSFISNASYDINFSFLGLNDNGQLLYGSGGLGGTIFPGTNSTSQNSTIGSVLWGNAQMTASVTNFPATVALSQVASKGFNQQPWFMFTEI